MSCRQSPELTRAELIELSKLSLSVATALAPWLVPQPEPTDTPEHSAFMSAVGRVKGKFEYLSLELNNLPQLERCDGLMEWQLFEAELELADVVEKRMRGLVALTRDDDAVLDSALEFDRKINDDCESRDPGFADRQLGVHQRLIDLNSGKGGAGVVVPVDKPVPSEEADH